MNTRELMTFDFVGKPITNIRFNGKPFIDRAGDVFYEIESITVNGIEFILHADPQRRIYLVVNENEVT